MHASPSRVHVNIDDSRSAAAQPSTCYPDIAFAVDDFSDAFQSLVLSDPDDCYCVLLHADVRASWRPFEAAAVATHGGEGAATGGGSGSSIADAVQLEAADLAGLRLGDEPVGNSGSHGNQHWQRQQQRLRDACPEREVQVFSGYVSHSQLAEAMANGRSGGPEALRRLLGEPARKEVSRVLMRGPGGLGGADVAVTCLGPAASRGSHLGTSTSAASIGNEGGGYNGGQRPIVQGQRSPLPRLVQDLARGLAGVARKAAAVAAGEPPPLQPQQLSCALMTLLVPVEVLAAAILGAV